MLMDGRPGMHPEGPGEAEVARTLADPAFRELVRARGRLGAVVVGLTVVAYFGYIALLVAAPALMHAHATAVVTAGFPLGLGVMIVTFGLVLFYVLRSGGRLDALAARLRAGAAR